MRCGQDCELDAVCAYRYGSYHVSRRDCGKCDGVRFATRPHNGCAARDESGVACHNSSKVVHVSCPRGARAPVVLVGP